MSKLFETFFILLLFWSLKSNGQDVFWHWIEESDNSEAPLKFAVENNEIATVGYSSISKRDYDNNIIWKLTFTNGFWSSPEIAIKDDGGVAVAGQFNDTLEISGIQLISEENNDIAFLNLDAAGNLIGASRFGGPGYEGNGQGGQQLGKIAELENGNFAITGSFEGDASLGGIPFSAEGYDIFIAMLNQDGIPIWVKTIGDAECSDCYQGLTTLATNENQIITTGAYFEFGIELEGIEYPAIDIYNIVLTKYSEDGELQFIKFFSSPESLNIQETVIDSLGFIYVKGTFSDHFTYEGVTHQFGEDNGGFLAKLSPDGDLMWLQFYITSWVDLNISNRTLSDNLFLGPKMQFYTHASGNDDEGWRMEKYVGNGIKVDSFNTSPNFNIESNREIVQDSINSFLLGERGIDQIFARFERIDPNCNHQFWELIAEDSIRLCEPDTVVISTYFTTDSCQFSYTWNTGDTTNLISPVVDTTSYLKVTLTDQDNRSWSDSIKIIVDPDPNPYLNLGDDLEIFFGDTVRLDAGSGWTSIQWSTGATTSAIGVVPETSGSYAVTVIDSCGSSAISAVEVTVKPYKWEPLGELQASNIHHLIDSEGNLFVVGNFYDTLQVDESTTLIPGVDWEWGGKFFLKYDQFRFLKRAFVLEGDERELVKRGVVLGDSETLYTVSIVGSDPDHDVKLEAIDSTGSIIFTKVFSGPLSDSPLNMVKDESGHLIMTGVFEEELNFGEYTLTSQEGWDIFLVKLNSLGEVIWALNVAAGAESDIARYIGIDQDNHIYLSGYYKGVTEFDTITTLTTDYAYNAFLAKYNSNGNLQWVIDTKEGASQGGQVIKDEAGNWYWDGSFLDSARIGSFQVKASDNTFWTDYLVRFNQFGEILSVVYNQKHRTNLGQNSYIFSNEPNSVIFWNHQADSVTIKKFDDELNEIWSFKEYWGHIGLAAQFTTNRSGRAYLKTRFRSQTVITEYKEWDVGCNIDPLDLENIIISCNTGKVLLSTGNQFESYLWSTGETTSSIEVDSSGIYGLTVTDNEGCISTDSIIVSKELCTDLKEDMPDGLSIYPNPSSGKLSFLSNQDISRLLIQITDLTGKPIYQQTLNGLRANLPRDMSMNGVEEGIYLIRISTPTGSHVQKLIFRK